MEKIGKRIYAVRKSLDLTMEKFGEEIGITKSSVSSLEKSINNPSDQTLKLICKTFKVDPFWLETGEGDMFTAIPETLIDAVVDEYDLNERDRIVIETYLEAPNEQQKALMDFLLTLAKKVQKKDKE